MKLLNDLLGLAVLTSPLWLILILIPVAIWIAVKAARRVRGAWIQIGVGLLVTVLVLLVPFADEIAGSAYFNHLCATEAGTKVYATVALPSEYWDEQGRPKFFNKFGYLDHDFWTKWIEEKSEGIQRYSPIFGIDKDVVTVRDRRDHKLLGEIITFRSWGGWIRRNLSASNTADSCQFLHDADFSRQFYGKLFRSTKSQD